MCEFRTRRNGQTHPIHSGDGQIAQMMREAKYGRCAGCGASIEMCESCNINGRGFCPRCKARIVDMEREQERVERYGQGYTIDEYERKR